MDASHAEEIQRLIRQVRTRLDALGRAGLDLVPRPKIAEGPAVRFPVATARRAMPSAAEPAVSVPPPPTARDEPTRSKPKPKPTAPPGVVATRSLFGPEEISDPVIPAEERPTRLAALAAQVALCDKCSQLASCRTNTVFGEGNPQARLMFIGEAPGADEDASGRPFVGRAGQLLTDMIEKGMGIQRLDVYIANILKCRPPGNRDPLPEESRNCLHYLEQQIAMIRPEFLCLLGRVSASILLETALAAGKLRGRWHRYKGIPTIVTWHPAYLLRNPAAKRETWEDLQMLMQAMGIKPPARKSI